MPTPSSGPVLYWRLRYADGSYATEQPDSAYQSIRWARPGAVALQLVTNPQTPQGEGVREIALRAGERPIFYRRHSRDVDLDGSLGATQCEAVVYGRADDSGAAQLWCVLRTGRGGLDRPVPRWARDDAMITLQVAG